MVKRGLSCQRRASGFPVCSCQSVALPSGVSPAYSRRYPMPQGCDSAEFQAAMQRDAEQRLGADLTSLLDQLPPKEREFRERELAGFSRLFARFLSERGPSVEWDRIEKLPEGAVSTLCACACSGNTPRMLREYPARAPRLRSFARPTPRSVAVKSGV